MSNVERVSNCLETSSIKNPRMGKILLYTAAISPPAHSVKLTAEALGLELEIKALNLLAGDHLKPDFIKLNPQHTVPVIIDTDGTIVYDSHAINVYLTTKYAKDDELYPSDIVTRAKINAALHFDSGVLFSRLRFYFEPILYCGSSESPQAKIDYLYKAYELLNDTLVNDYIVGNKLTLADLSCIASIAAIDAIFPFDKNTYPKLAAWVERMSKLPYYNKAHESAEALAALCRLKLEENGKSKAKSL
ncbi:glutathione S-transferase 1-like [Malaya genurostris]|uniref:glutathione S-transferase 1-like n=1 Tax=Malaya genurostris TaxID=325434 RepID=UPI0026F3C2D5|nr:glutathione S-transferase 1-like [Malaya genurostris]